MVWGRVRTSRCASSRHGQRALGGCGIAHARYSTSCVRSHAHDLRRLAASAWPGARSGESRPSAHSVCCGRRASGSPPAAVPCSGAAFRAGVRLPPANSAATRSCGVRGARSPIVNVATTCASQIAGSAEYVAPLDMERMAVSKSVAMILRIAPHRRRALIVPAGEIAFSSSESPRTDRTFCLAADRQAESIRKHHVENASQATRVMSRQAKLWRMAV
jgi:hypothetical protein